MELKYKTKIKDFQDEFVEYYPELLIGRSEHLRKKNELAVKTITIIVTEDCSLRCSYCYQNAKNSFHAMTKETARKIVDLLFQEDAKDNIYLNKYNSVGIILDFIGGEPLLEIELIDYFLHYFRFKAIQLNHRWAIYHMVSITTNGILYNSPKVQEFLFKNYGRISIAITIDGNKELHDSCRLFPDGSPSYDIVANSMKSLIKNFGRSTTKLTLAPSNIKFLFPAIKNLYEEFQLKGVFSNCIFEEGWTIKDAQIFYKELKKISNWIIKNNIEQDFYCTLFDELIGSKKGLDDNDNWCGGTGAMLSFTSNGNIQPCLRYTDFNLNQKQLELDIGSLEHGICYTQKEKDLVKFLDSITRKSQSTEECFNCPIASGCAWCSAYNYEVYGTPDKRATFICPMHKARVLANVYYWNKIYKKYNIDKKFEMNCPKEWALEIVSKEEYEMLCNLTK
jgi:uncharacterized protein